MLGKLEVFLAFLLVAIDLVVVATRADSLYDDIGHFYSYQFNAYSYNNVFAGIVGGGNYSYYTYTGDGKLRLTLRSIDGDTDLYIGEQILRPTFELNNYHIQSTSCGDDVIEVSSLLKRPIGIGVYGHPSYEVSRYSLEVAATNDAAGDETYHTIDRMYNTYPDDESMTSFDDVRQLSEDHYSRLEKEARGSTKSAKGEKQGSLLSFILEVFAFFIEALIEALLQ